MMKIKARYESKDEIPEQYADLYTEKKGGWELTGVEGMKTEADVERINTTMRSERDARKEAEKKLKAWEKLGEYDEIVESLDKLPELESAAGGKLDEEKIQELAEKRAQRILAPKERELEKLREQNQTFEAQIGEFQQRDKMRKIEDAARAAATKVKMREEAVDDFLMLARTQFDVAEDGAVVTEAGLDPETMLGDLKEKKPHWWSQAQGGGAPGAGGPGGSAVANPFDPKHKNLTRQMEIIRENPERAKRLARAAGVDPAKLGL